MKIVVTVFIMRSVLVIILVAVVVAVVHVYEI